MSSDKKHLHRYNRAQPSHRPTTLSELAILQKNHQFIRDDDDNESGIDHSKLSWEDKLALSWYSKLFREFALCDLTHYKTGGVALRWRTESEVLDRIGELTCGNLHCKYHKPVDSPEDRLDDDDMRPLVPRELTPYQLNFQYQEQGKAKQALVKVVLCPKCKSKLTWKKDQERLARGEEASVGASSELAGRVSKGKGRSTEIEGNDRNSGGSDSPKRVRSSRSRSPNRSGSQRQDANCKATEDSAEHERRPHSSRKHDSRKEPSSISKPRIRTVITSLMGKYYDAILDGSKTWEGRTNTPRYATLRPDDEFVFHHAEDASRPAFTVRILDVQKFDNFRDMLDERVQDFLPGVQTLQEAVDVYENIPGYRDQVKEHGAAAFRIQVLDRGDSEGVTRR